MDYPPPDGHSTPAAAFPFPAVLEALVRTLSLLGLFLSASAFAAPSHTVTTVKTAINLHDFVCITYIGLAGQDTQIGNGKQSVFLFVKEVELKHTLATAEGCDLRKLEPLQKEAMMGFGFLRGVPVTITKDLSESRRAPNGNCVADFSEKVDIALTDGIVLTSELGELRQMNDCR